MAQIASWIGSTASTTFSRCFIAATIASRRYISSIILQRRHADVNDIQSPRVILFFDALSLFINLVEVKFQGKPYSPFETHPITMTTGIVNLILYLLALDALHWLPFESRSHANVVILYLSTIFGYMSLTCMASLLLPNKAKPFLFICGSFISVAVMLCPLLRARHSPIEWSYWRMRIFHPSLQNFWRIVRRRSPNNILPH